MNTTLTLEKQKIERATLRAIWWITIILISISAFEVIAVATAMPEIARILQGQDLYSISFGVTMAGQLFSTVMAGQICDKTGPKISLLWGVFLFMLGISISGFSLNMWIFCLGRAVQGVGVGITLVSLYVIISEVVPEKIRPKYFAAIATAWVIPSLIGPVITGIIVDFLSWRIVFILVPIIIIFGSYFAYPFILKIPLRKGPIPKLEFLTADKSKDPEILAMVRKYNVKDRKLLLSALGLALGTALVQTLGSKDSPVIGIWQYILLGISLFAIFSAFPRLTPPGTYKLRPGLPSLVMSRVFLMGPYVAAELFLPLFLDSRGWSTTESGTVLTVGAITWAISSQIQGIIPDDAIRAKYAPWGCFIGAFGILITGVATTGLLAPYTVLIGWGIMGFGIGFAYPCITLLALDQAPDGKFGETSGALQLADTLGSALCVAFVGVISAIVSAPWHIALPVLCSGALMNLAGLFTFRNKPKI